jgi:hypothetical protein
MHRHTEQRKLRDGHALVDEGERLGLGVEADCAAIIVCTCTGRGHKVQVSFERTREALTTYGEFREKVVPVERVRELRRSFIRDRVSCRASHTNRERSAKEW